MSQSFAEFNAKVAASPELQAALRSICSPAELMALAQAQGCSLTGDDLKELAQQAYQQWIVRLSGSSRSFFEQAQAIPTLNQSLKQCRTPEEVIALAAMQGVELTRADLQQAAAAAETVSGFSFEKLWFRALGLIS